MPAVPIRSRGGGASKLESPRLLMVQLNRHIAGLIMSMGVKKERAVIEQQLYPLVFG